MDGGGEDHGPGMTYVLQHPQILDILFKGYASQEPMTCECDKPLYLHQYQSVIGEHLTSKNSR